MSPLRLRIPGGTPGREFVTDVAITVATGAVTMLTIAVAFQEGSDFSLSATGAYAFGVAMTLPLLVRRRLPLTVLLVTSLLMFGYYQAGGPGMSPAGVLAVPLYTVALVGRLFWAAAIATFFYTAGSIALVVTDDNAVLETVAKLIPHIALTAVVILLGEVVRSRRALAEESRERLRRATREREREAARRVAEERVRIARELHDTVAHSMATITVQAGSALHVLRDRGEAQVRDALTAIRDTSKEALREMRATLGVLREGPEAPPPPSAGLDRLPALVDAVRAAGVPVALEITGDRRPLDRPVDHTAYRILQESLTNVLRHAGPEVKARVTISYDQDAVRLEVIDDGHGASTNADGSGHGLGGMRERAEAVGGTVMAGPRPEGGFAVSARLPQSTPKPADTALAEKPGPPGDTALALPGGTVRPGDTA